MAMDNKICNKCGESLALNSDNFWKRKNLISGFESTCKKCLNKKKRKPIKEGKIINPITGLSIQDMSIIKFGRLTPIKLDMNRMNVNYNNNNKTIYWLCKCDCNNEELVSVSTQCLKNGKVSSCGCNQKEAVNNKYKEKALNKVSIADYIINDLCKGDKAKLKQWWDFKKNDELELNPYEITYQSSKKVWIMCQNKEYHESYLTSPSKIVKGCRCPYCSGRKIHSKDSLGQHIVDNYGKDFLDKVWSDKNEVSPFEYTTGTNKKAWWKCSNGKHNEFKRDIASSKRFEFKCPKCNDIISYPNKLMQTLLEQLEIEFISEYSPNWIKPKRYDFYIPSMNLIIEMDGGWHFKDNNMSGQTIEKSKELDNYKDIKAINNGLNIIRIDCRISELEYIKSKIIKSELSKLFELNKIKWDGCSRHLLFNTINKLFELYDEGKTPNEISDITGISVCTIRKHLKNNPNYLGNRVLQKQVRCTETGDIFNSIAECSILSEEKFGVKISDSGISRVCNKKRKTCHKFHFEFIEEVSINE